MLSEYTPLLLLISGLVCIHWGHAVLRKYLPANRALRARDVPAELRTLYKHTPEFAERLILESIHCTEDLKEGLECVVAEKIVIAYVTIISGTFWVVFAFLIR